MAKRKLRLASVILASILLSCVSIMHGAQAAQRSGWLQLDLAETTIADITVYYEQALEPNLPVFERCLQSFASGRAGASELLEQRDQIVADINRILGVVDANSTAQGDMLVKFAGVFATVQPTFYLVRMDTIKDFLRAGGELPDCTYNRIEDTVLYRPYVFMQSHESLPEGFDLCIPISADDPFDKYVSAILEVLGGSLGSPLTVAVHEVTEMTLLFRARPTDPYWRWFSDGFADAITHVLVAKYLGPEAAQESAGRDLEDHRDLEQEVNLAYWMMGNFTAYVSDPPVEKEGRIMHARYAYAMYEAQRLIEEHGIECVREILDEIAARDSRRGSDLLEVIEEVTGADMEARLAHYQTFATRQEGVPKYGLEYQAAEKEQDWETMFVDIMRIMELRGDVFSVDYLISFRQAALFLFKMGEEAAGDRVMRQAIELYEQSPVEHGREVALEAFLNYAILCSNPSKASNEADELLKADPNTNAALTVKMMIAAEHRNLPEARELAERILKRAGERSLNRRLANQVLAIDPNTLGPLP